MQIELVKSYYLCQSCDNLGDEPLRRIKRFRVCAACFSAYRQPAGDWAIEQVIAQNQIFLAWYAKMERRYPAKYVAQSVAKSQAWQPSGDQYPVCDCGATKAPLGFSRTGLWGGPFRPKCERCQVEADVRNAFANREKRWPDRDYEDLLDLLFLAFPDWFQLGIMPDLWFTLMLEEKNK